MKRERRVAALLALAAILALAGCASTAYKVAAGAASRGAGPAEDAPAPAARTADAPAAPAARGGGAPPAPAGARPQEMASRQEPATAQPVAQGQPERRLRVYSGTLELVVPAPLETAQRIIALVQQSGGYVESSTADVLVVRVPAAQFETIFESLGRLGEIRSRSVESADVTDQYRDVSKRAEVSERTRARLYALLGKTSNADERVRILREIRRLTEEIEQLKATLAMLDQQVKLSRITVRLAARLAAGPADGRPVPFGWIARLDPLRGSTGGASSPIGLAAPEDFAVFSSERLLSAESAEGTRLRAGAAANEPDGDTAFWHKALLFHLGPRYREAEPVTAGPFRGALFTSKDAQPFFYLVAVAVRGREILVAEAFFPDRAAKERRLAQVSRLLGEGRP